LKAIVSRDFVGVEEIYVFRNNRGYDVRYDPFPYLLLSILFYGNTAMHRKNH